jgi:tetratricopeptide (TPR) repeat protein
LAEILTHISHAFYLHGDLQSAKQSIQESLDIARQINNKSHVARAMANWAEILMAEGDLPQARKNLEEALQIRTQIEQKSDANATRLQLAALSIAEGNAVEAEHAGREVRDEYRKEGHHDDEIRADAVLLQALHVENKSSEAEEEASKVNLVVARSQNLRTRLSIAIVDAQIQADSGKWDEAVLNLASATRDAARFGFVPDQLEARLAHADIELRAGKVVAGRAELVALRKDAARKGFDLIAHEATALMNRKPHGP